MQTHIQKHIHTYMCVCLHIIIIIYQFCTCNSFQVLCSVQSYLWGNQQPWHNSCHNKFGKGILYCLAFILEAFQCQYEDRFIFILMKTKDPLNIMVFKMIIRDGDIMPLFIFPHGLRLNTEAYIKCLKLKLA